MRALAFLVLVVGCDGSKPEETADTGEADTQADTDSGGGGAEVEPMTNPEGAQGRTWSFLLADATITEPANLGSIITAYMSTPVMVSATTISATSLDLLGGLGVVDSKPHAQDTCLPTFDFPASTFDAQSPTFTAGPADASLYVLGTAVPVFDLVLGGTFSADGTTIQSGTLSGVVDTRPIGPLLNGGGGEGAVCEAAKNFGVTCVECPSQDGAFCLDLSADSFVLAETPGTLVTVKAECE